MYSLILMIQVFNQLLVLLFYQIYNQSVSSKKSIHKAILNGAKSLRFYPNNPRMVPVSLQPQCHKMYITIPEENKKTQAIKNKRSSFGGKQRQSIPDAIKKQGEIYFHLQDLSKVSGVSFFAPYQLLYLMCYSVGHSYIFDTVNPRVKGHWLEFTFLTLPMAEPSARYACSTGCHGSVQGCLHSSALVHSKWLWEPTERCLAGAFFKESIIIMVE